MVNANNLLGMNVKGIINTLKTKGVEYALKVKEDYGFYQEYNKIVYKIDEHHFIMLIIKNDCCVDYQTRER